MFADVPAPQVTCGQVERVGGLGLLVRSLSQSVWHGVNYVSSYSLFLYLLVHMATHQRNPPVIEWLAKHSSDMCLKAM